MTLKFPPLFITSANSIIWRDKDYADYDDCVIKEHDDEANALFK